MAKNNETTSVKLYRSDYVMQGIAHVVLMTLTLLALLPFLLLTWVVYTSPSPRV